MLKPPYHPAVADLLRYFEFSHLPPHLQEISRPFHDLAHDMANRGSGPQVRDGLFDLLRAKDCFVRAALPPVVRDFLAAESSGS